MTTTEQIKVDIAPAFHGLFKPKRFMIYHGGRGGGKSWNIARYLILRSLKRPTRILCTREFQSSMKDSVYKLLLDQIESMGLGVYFNITRDSIKNIVGSEFIFKGIKHNSQEIKSTEGLDVIWVEEAQNTSHDSWEVLIPTLRKKGSFFIVSFNPSDVEASTHKRFIVRPPPYAHVQQVNWNENPWFPAVLDQERRYMQESDPDAYEHVWGGQPKRISDAIVFNKRVEVASFEFEDDGYTQLYYGVDWGFANDPTALIRCWVKNDFLYIDHEAFGYGVELDELPALFDTVPDVKRWAIRADNSRPETISHVTAKGYNVSAASKWAGSIEDGLTVLKSFKKIYVHERCKHLLAEFRLYSYKVDRVTNQILPVLVDKNNHGIDALRYALDDIIADGGYNSAYAKL